MEKPTRLLGRGYQGKWGKNMAWKERPKETKNFQRSREISKSLWGQGDRAQALQRVKHQAQQLQQSPMDPRSHGWFSKRDMDGSEL